MTLAREFKSGTSQAIGEVYRQYGRSAFAVAYKLLGRRDLAEEAVQEAFVRAWKAVDSFDASKELGPWLATITRRVAIDIHRREARRTHADIATSTTEPALVSLPPGIEQAYEVWETRQALDELPDEERKLIEMQHRYGLTHQEIAERLGLPLGTVKSRTFRAHKRLAVRLGHLRHETETPARA